MVYKQLFSECEVKLKTSEEGRLRRMLTYESRGSDFAEPKQETGFADYNGQ